MRFLSVRDHMPGGSVHFAVDDLIRRQNGFDRFSARSFSERITAGVFSAIFHHLPVISSIGRQRRWP